MAVVLKALLSFFFAVLGLALIAPTTGGINSGECDGCGRHGQVGEVKSPAWTPTEKDLEEVRSILLPGAEFKPGVKVPYIMKESIWYRLVEQLL